MPARKKPAGKKPVKSPQKPAVKPAAKKPAGKEATAKEPAPKKATPKTQSASLPVDPVKLAKARQLLRLDDDAATIRRALDYLLEHYHPVGYEEEE
jgi:hypothetical protein